MPMILTWQSSASVGILFRYSYIINGFQVKSRMNLIETKIMIQMKMKTSQDGHWNSLEATVAED